MRRQALGRDDLQHIGASVGHGQQIYLLFGGLVQHGLHHGEHRVEERRSVQNHYLYDSRHQRTNGKKK